MASIFDSVRVYKNDWKELSKRNFTEEECNAVQKVTVVTSGWGFSACFFMAAGKSFIPFEPSSNVEEGDEVDIKDLKLVALEYQGNNPAITKKNVLRIRVEKHSVQATSFDNPFGI